MHYFFSIIFKFRKTYGDLQKIKSMKVIDFESWNRKEHFEFFSGMKSPFFGFTTEVDCTKAYDDAKEKGYSFMLFTFINRWWRLIP
jgi:chloramphenicol O-acetyltransferase